MEVRRKVGGRGEDKGLSLPPLLAEFERAWGSDLRGCLCMPKNNRGEIGFTLMGVRGTPPFSALPDPWLQLNKEGGECPALAGS